MDAMKQRFGIQDDLQRDHNRGRDRRPHRPNDPGEESTSRIAGKYHRVAGCLSLFSRATARASHRLRPAGHRRAARSFAATRRLRGGSSDRKPCARGGNQVKSLQRLGLFRVWCFCRRSSRSQRTSEIRAALAHWKTHGEEFPPERVFVIGDTPRDIECGKAVGAKTVAIATGNYSRSRPCWSTNRTSYSMICLTPTRLSRFFSRS